MKVEIASRGENGHTRNLSCLLTIVLFLPGCYKSDVQKKGKAAEEMQNNIADACVTLLYSIGIKSPGIKSPGIKKSSVLGENIATIRRRLNHSGFTNVGVSPRSDKQFIVTIPDQHISSIDEIRFLVEKPGKLSYKTLFRRWRKARAPTNEEVEKLISEAKESLEGTVSLWGYNKIERIRFGAPKIKGENLVSYPEYKRDAETNELVFDKETGNPVVERWCIVNETKGIVLNSYITEAKMDKLRISGVMLCISYSKKGQEAIGSFLKENYGETIVSLCDDRVIGVAEYLSTEAAETDCITYVWPEELKDVIPSIVMFGPLTQTVSFETICFGRCSTLDELSEKVDRTRS